MPENFVLNDVSKRYGQADFIIDGLYRVFVPGTATGLTGPNGSGKTTLLRMLTTAAYPTSGNIYYGDLDIHQHPHEFLKYTGFAFDNNDLPQFASSEELLELILRARGKWDDESPAKIDELLGLLGLDERRKNLIGTYSSGMMQKTLLAAALIADPELVMLDEPFRALDTATRKALTDFLNVKKDNGTTIIIASHLPEVIDKLCDSVIRFPII